MEHSKFVLRASSSLIHSPHSTHAAARCPGAIQKSRSGVWATINAAHRRALFVRSGRQRRHAAGGLVPAFDLFDAPYHAPSHQQRWTPANLLLACLVGSR